MLYIKCFRKADENSKNIGKFSFEIVFLIIALTIDWLKLDIYLIIKI